MVESTPKGWIKLQRDLIRQEVFRDSDTLRVFLYLVCRAVTNTIVFNGITIERGQFAATYAQLANALNINERRIRRIIVALKTADYVAHKKAYGNTHGFVVITICKYDNYLPATRSQNSASGRTKWRTNGHTNGQNPSVDTLYIDRELSTDVDNNRVVEVNSTPSSDFEKVLIEKLIDDDVWKGKIAGTFGLDETNLIKRLDEFFISNECRGKFHKDLSDLKSHFVNWLKIILNPKSTKTNNNESKHAARRSSDVPPVSDEDDSTF
ncbi:MAG: hypothetical protein NC111_06605 [Bacteroides sp.]|nr:hypothetical protein [Bacteroides sp.]MCM1413083.1 hypothetical protein [Bacteroides sp.]MCM1472175.1 hypothetical protein [Bacteroides sp.]